MEEAQRKITDYQKNDKKLLQEANDHKTRHTTPCPAPAALHAAVPCLHLRSTYLYRAVLYNAAAYKPRFMDVSSADIARVESGVKRLLCNTSHVCAHECTWCPEVRM
jgi:hypothetical protein